MIDKSDLRGLDTFNQEQAAHYMNRSLSKFKMTVKALGVPHYFVDGIKTFRKTDLQAAQEKERMKQWQLSDLGENHGISAGRSRVRPVRQKKGASRSVVYLAKRPKQPGLQRNTS